MKALVRRLFCCHLYWHKAFLPRRWPAWWQTEWECDHCGKRIVRDNNNPPVQFVSATRKARHEAPAKEKTMSDKQTNSAGDSLPPPLGSRIERIMDELMDIEYHSGCSARVEDMVHRAIGYLESARHAANAPLERSERSGDTLRGVVVNREGGNT